MKRFTYLGLLILLARPGISVAEEFTIKGTIVDAGGKPVAGVEVANFWTFDQGKPSAWKGVKSGADGSFAFKVDIWAKTASLAAYDMASKCAGVVEFTPAEAATPVTIKLGPVLRVHGEFVSKDLGRSPGWTNLYIMMPGDARILQCMSRESKFDVLLPPGKYKFYGYGSDIQNCKRDLDLTDQDLDLKQLDVPATAIAKLVGKTPPAWNVTDARGISKTITLADLKGKWVVVEFWGFW